jgi:hypothetical protein
MRTFRALFALRWTLAVNGGGQLLDDGLRSNDQERRYSLLAASVI